MNWLDSRGFRERTLQSNLSKLEDVIADGMSRRNKDILSKQEAIPIRSVRTRENINSTLVETFLEYVNRYAT